MKILKSGLFVMLSLILWACGGTPQQQNNTSTNQTEEQTKMIIKDDLAGLKELLALPEEVSGARWGTEALGIQGGRAPGPTDYVLYAVLEVPEGSSPDLGPKATMRTKIHKSLLAEFLSEEALSQLNIQDGKWEPSELFSGETLNKGSYKVSYAGWVDSTHIWVTAQTY